MRIRYEDLASSPKQAIAEACDLLNLQFEPGMLDFWKTNHHSVNGNAGSRSFLLRYREKKWEGSLKGTRKQYYEDHPIAIRLDERWRQELTDGQIESVNSIIGERNKLLIK